MAGESGNQDRARPLVALLALAAGAYGVVVAADGPPPAVAAPKAAAAVVTELPDAVSAALAARNQGSRVEITGARTESTTTWANPDGTFTTDAASGAGPGAPGRRLGAGRHDPLGHRRASAGQQTLPPPAVMVGGGGHAVPVRHRGGVVRLDGA